MLFSWEKGMLQCNLLSLIIGGSRGLRRRTPPNRVQFFRFCICFHQKVPMSEFGAPQRLGAPPTRNPGSATVDASCLNVNYCAQLISNPNYCQKLICDVNCCQRRKNVISEHRCRNQLLTRYILIDI